jgi:hypothetical protein
MVTTDPPTAEESHGGWSMAPTTDVCAQYIKR